MTKYMVAFGVKLPDDLKKEVANLQTRPSRMNLKNSVRN